VGDLTQSGFSPLLLPLRWTGLSRSIWSRLTPLPDWRPNPHWGEKRVELDLLIAGKGRCPLRPCGPPPPLRGRGEDLSPRLALNPRSLQDESAQSRWQGTLSAFLSLHLNGVCTIRRRSHGVTGEWSDLASTDRGLRACRGDEEELATMQGGAFDARTHWEGNHDDDGWWRSATSWGPSTILFPDSTKEQNTWESRGSIIRTSASS